MPTPYCNSSCGRCTRTTSLCGATQSADRAPRSWAAWISSRKWEALSPWSCRSAGRPASRRSRSWTWGWGTLQPSKTSASAKSRLATTWYCCKNCCSCTDSGCFEWGLRFSSLSWKLCFSVLSCPFRRACAFFLARWTVSSRVQKGVLPFCARRDRLRLGRRRSISYLGADRCTN